MNEFSRPGDKVVFVGYNKSNGEILESKYHYLKKGYLYSVKKTNTIILKNTKKEVELLEFNGLNFDQKYFENFETEKDFKIGQKVEIIYDGYPPGTIGTINDFRHGTFYVSFSIGGCSSEDEFTRHELKPAKDIFNFYNEIQIFKNKIVEETEKILGWICPKCGCGNNPAFKVCPCSEVKYKGEIKWMS